MERKYSASFTSGALMPDETEVVVNFILDKGHNYIKQLTETDNILKINSLVARKVKVGEILKRYKSADADLWKIYLNLKSKDEKKAFLYYICLKTYNLIRDFHMEVVITKWRQLETKLDREDVKRFLIRASDDHSEIDKWTDNTINKVAQVIILMMKEAGLLENGKLNQVYLPEYFWTYFIKAGDSWFLEAMLLSKEQRQNLIKGV